MAQNENNRYKFSKGKDAGSVRLDTVVSCQLYYRTVLNGTGIIETPEPYCEKHIIETNNIGDRLIPTGEFTNKKCVICQIVGN